MPIYVPGKRSTKHKRGGSSTTKRNAMANLSLTSMIDVFTILVIFLLQNYSSTGEIIQIPKDVHLPEAGQVKELKPAHVVTITKDKVKLDKDEIIDLATVQAQKEWMIPTLFTAMSKMVQLDQLNYRQTLAETMRNVVPGAKHAPMPSPEDFRKVTVQADKDLEFVTVKKIMFTISEAGATEINFAVMKRDAPLTNPDEQDGTPEPPSTM